MFCKQANNSGPTLTLDVGDAAAQTGEIADSTLDAGVDRLQNLIGVHLHPPVMYHTYRYIITHCLQSVSHQTFHASSLIFLQFASWPSNESKPNRPNKTKKQTWKHKTNFHNWRSWSNVESQLLVFNAQPSNTVISRRCTVDKTTPVDL